MRAIVFAALVWVASSLGITHGEQKSVVFVGSSSIERWTTLEQDFPGVRVVHRDISAELQDADDTVDSEIVPYNPDVIVVYDGDNDLWNGRTTQNVLDDFKIFKDKVFASLPDVRIVYISIKPSPSRWRIRSKIVRANALVAEEVSRDPRLRYVDIYSAMLGADGRPDKQYFVEDMLHLNAAGYALWKELIERELN